MNRFAAVILALGLAACGQQPAPAPTETATAEAAAPAPVAAGVTVSEAAVSPVPADRPATAGYLKIVNAGAEADRLIAAASPAVRTIELHTHEHGADGVMKMRPVEGGVPIPPGETVQFAPGGLHLMMFGPAAAIEEGAEVPITLTFEKAGEVQITAIAKAPTPGH